MQFCELMTSFLPTASGVVSPSASTYSYTAAGHTRPSKPAYSSTLVLTCSARFEASMCKWTGWSSAWLVPVRETEVRISNERTPSGAG